MKSKRVNAGVILKQKCIKSFCICFMLVLSIIGHAQDAKRKNYFPIWSYHQDSINIHGVSVGLWSFSQDVRYTNTNGVKIELIGAGLLIPLIPRSPIVENDSAFIKLKQDTLSERINGLNLSATGSVCHCKTNGLTAGLVGQIHFQVNGVSAALFANYIQKHNGLMLAMFNEAYETKGLQVGLSNYGYKASGLQLGIVNGSKAMKGLQVGVYNKSESKYGVQIGLWNVNQRRKMPFINWSFKQKGD